MQASCVFIVRDHLFHKETNIWYAHFSCVDDPAEQGTEVGTGTGNGQNLN